MAVIAAASWKVDTDDQLCARFRARERGALEELFRRHRLRAYRVAFRLLGREKEALEAVREGFIKVMRELDACGQGCFKARLLRYVSDAAVEHRRRRRIACLANTSIEEPLEPNPRRFLEEALASLPDALCRTFILHADGRLTYCELAEAMEIPRDAVMSRLSEARHELRAYLAQ
jgi:RNA polymerase sigma-70 factor (ECF subfamily)